LEQGAYIVADFGKTMAKVTLWSKAGSLLERRTRDNARMRAPHYTALDVEAIGGWFIDTLKSFAKHPIQAIIPVSHGAAVAAITGDALTFAPLDYEQDIPHDTVAAYRQQRDPFAHTGSPSLPQGLNIGTQLAWLESLYGPDFKQATLLPYAQYWAWFLSGVATTEVTSLGCHSDLWSPASQSYSAMAKRRGWAAQFAPIAKASDAIGTLKPDLAHRTGLNPAVRIHAGLHDSNAALLAARGFPEIAEAEATVLSTGTWFIGMRTPAAPVDLSTLPEARDCLVNVDAHGAAIPSARFMGGREIENRIKIDTRRIDIKPDQAALIAAVPDVVAAGIKLLPCFAPGFGPFPEHEGMWINEPVDKPENANVRRAAVSLYAALVANAALDLIGAKECILVEGRFAEAEVFVRALASLRPDAAIYVANAHNDVSFGALRLLIPDLKPASTLRRVAPLDTDIADYAVHWQNQINQRGETA
jgi:sugar (pentulose or hexulose) kinase